jgi:glutaminyl-peptide cyclotransferase
MRRLVLLFLVFLNILSSCDEKEQFKIEFTSDIETLKLNDELNFSIRSIEGKTVESVEYEFQDKKGRKDTDDISIPLTDLMLGNHKLKVKVFSEEEVYEFEKKLTVLNDTPPKIYAFEVVNAYPHQITSYTQGLEFKGDSLFESVGQYGESKLLQVDLETGKIIREHKLKRHYFAEGLTIIGDKLYQLTWREGEGLIYDVNSFEVEDKFRYNQSKEGWGLCHDEKYVYKSDGTEKIWRLDKNTLAEIDYIQPTTHKSVSSKLNELEYVNGKIYANTYQKDGVAIIDPQNGAIEAVINFKSLKNQVKQHEDLDVLNGIAYHTESKKLYVTGKNWNKLFEVKIIPK